jgi:hypothetical protein
MFKFGVFTGKLHTCIKFHLGLLIKFFWDIVSKNLPTWNLRGRQITMGQVFRIPHTKIGYDPKFQLFKTNFDKNFWFLAQIHGRNRSKFSTCKYSQCASLRSLISSPPYFQTCAASHKVKSSQIHHFDFDLTFWIFSLFFRFFYFILIKKRVPTAQKSAKSVKY